MSCASRNLDKDADALIDSPEISASPSQITTPSSIFATICIDKGACSVCNSKRSICRCKASKLHLSPHTKLQSPAICSENRATWDLGKCHRMCSKRQFSTETV